MIVSVVGWQEQTMLMVGDPPQLKGFFAEIFQKNIIIRNGCLCNSSKYCCRSCDPLVIIWVTLMCSIWGLYSIILSFNVCAIRYMPANLGNVYIDGSAYVSFSSSSSLHDSGSSSKSSFANTSPWPSICSTSSRMLAIPLQQLVLLCEWFSELLHQSLGSL